MSTLSTRCPTAARARATRTRTRTTSRALNGSSEPSSATRRELMLGVGALTMISSLASRDRARAEEGAGKRPRVVITGANSGIGLDAATKLARDGWTVALACRTKDKAERARAEMVARGVDGADVECFACDLADLDSVRACAREIAGSGSVDALVLNAGVEYSGDPVVHRTKQGLEETVGVNHFAHFLLTNLLLTELEKSELAHPRIVVTASEVHDPASPGGSVGKGATLGDLAGYDRDGAAFEMASGEEFDADKAYKDSKLMNMLFTYELERRLLEKGSKVTVNAFGPGLITRTGLFRHQNPLFVKAFDFATNEVFHVAETVDRGGDCLVYMLTEPSLEGVGGTYFNNRLAPGTPPTGHAFERSPSSIESNDRDEALKLWTISERIVGLSA